MTFFGHSSSWKVLAFVLHMNYEFCESIRRWPFYRLLWEFLAFMQFTRRILAFLQIMRIFGFYAVYYENFGPFTDYYLRATLRKTVNILRVAVSDFVHRLKYFSLKYENFWPFYNLLRKIFGPFTIYEWWNFGIFIAYYKYFETMNNSV